MGCVLAELFLDGTALFDLSKVGVRVCMALSSWGSSPSYVPAFATYACQAGLPSHSLFPPAAPHSFWPTGGESTTPSPRWHLSLQRCASWCCTWCRSTQGRA